MAARTRSAPRPRGRNKQLLPDEEIAAIVHDDVTWAENYRIDYEEKWKRFYSIYKNYIDKATYPFEANLAIPTAFTIVAVQQAFLLDMIHEAGDFVEVMGKTPEGQAQARAVRELLNYHFSNSFDTFEDMGLFINQLLMYGTSIYKVFWEHTVGWKAQPNIVYNQEGEAVGYEKVLGAQVLEHQPAGYPVDIFHFGVDPNASCIKNARFVYEDMWLDPIKLRELEQQDIGFKNIDEAIRLAGNVNQGLSDRQDELGISNWQTPHQERGSNDVRGKVHIKDYWGFLVKGAGRGMKIKRNAMEQLYHVMVACPGNTRYGTGDPIVIFAEPSPFFHNRIPYVDARINATIGEFYGVGDLEYCESLLLEQRDIRNIQQDNIIMAINKMFKVKRDAGVNPAELIWRPGGKVFVEDVDDVTVLESAPLQPESFKAQDEIRKDLEHVTGVSDFMVGQFRSSSGFNDTATGISLIQNVALKRLGHKGQVIQRVIRDIGRMVFSLVGQYQPYGSQVRVLDRNSATQIRFLDISPEALRQQFDFNIINAPALGSKPVRVNQLVQLFQFLIQAKQIDQTFDFDLNLFVRRLIDEMDVPNSEEFFGFENAMKQLPEQLGSPTEGIDQQTMIPPDEENAIMINEGQFIIPKIEENHPHHMAVHIGAYQSLPENHPSRMLLEKHFNAHQNLAAQTKELMAQGLATEAAVSGAQNAASYVDGKAVQRAQGVQGQNLTGAGAKGNKSPTAAGGQENLSRAFGNLMAGNA